MSDDSFFDMDLPDIQGLTQQLDLFEEKQNEAVRNGLHKVGENMRRAQKRRISGVKGGQKLADAISVSKIYTTKKGVLGITSGYQAGAFKADSEGFNPGLVGMIREYGRPGDSPQRSKPTMKQKRKRLPGRTDYESGKGRKNWGEAVSKEVEISKGIIQPTPHIRLGFDETLEQNVQIMADAINEVIDKL